ncbi:hypothetical protein [Actinokineospora sp. NBRC 105648]|uniref:DUF7507 domain-containing protein n=1 Tax=Actinokineospora sp. NBRC 105648 TaxID=3032206 RepID=UPI0024A47838|nr:hypothetical protein [Actinokineospora sp. NBRC 105648]GLZ38886.1 hypothetical protein Acsp05_25100 [Actinokineospora sp. NBRC 105648]
MRIWSAREENSARRVTPRRFARGAAGLLVFVLVALSAAAPATAQPTDPGESASTSAPPSTPEVTSAPDASPPVSTPPSTSAGEPPTEVPSTATPPTTPPTSEPTGPAPTGPAPTSGAPTSTGPTSTGPTTSAAPTTSATTGVPPAPTLPPAPLAGPRAGVDLNLVKFAPEAAGPGATITWLLRVGNAGPGTATSFVVTDTVPASVTGVSATGAGCAVAGRTVSCSGGPLGPGDSVSFAISAVTPVPFVFPLVNTASVAAGPGDTDVNPGNNSATAVTTTAAPDPSLALVVTVDPHDVNGNGLGDIGERVSYAFQVTNTGNVTVFGLSVQHTGAGAVLCADTTLSIGESTTCAGPDHVITVADIGVGQVVTSSTATASAPDSAVARSATVVTNVPTFASAPGIALVTTAILVDANGDGLGEAGEQIDYRFSVSNTGNVPLTAITVATTQIPSANPCAAVGSLAPNATAECVRAPRYVITPQDVDNGAIVLTATASGVAPGGTVVTAEPSTATTPSFQSRPGISLVTTATAADENGDGLVEVGESIDFRFTITNTGNVRLTAIGVVRQSPAGAGGCPTGLELAPAETVDCSHAPRYVVTAADGANGVVTHTASAVGTAPDGTVITSRPTTTNTPVFLARPALRLVSTMELVDQNGNGIGDLGEPVRLSVTVTNTGNVALTAVSVEGLLSGIPQSGCQQAVLAIGQSATCVRDPYYISQADVLAGALIGVATAIGTAPDGGRVESAPVSDNIPVFVPVPVLAVVVDDLLGDLDGNGLADLGEVVDYTFTVTNSGNVAVTGLVVHDASGVGVTCPRTALAPGEHVVCTSDAGHTTTAADLAAAEVVKRATATATAPDAAAVVSPEASAHTPTFAAVPAVALDKTATLDDRNGNGLADLGETVQWTFLVVNNGNTALAQVRVDDPLAGPVTCLATSLRRQEFTTCSADRAHTVTEADIVAGKIDNTAVARAVGDAGGPPVVSPPDSTTTPTAAPAPALALTKSAELADLNGNDLADAGETVQYSFRLTNTGNQTLTQVRVDDPKAGPVTCPVTVLAPGASVVCVAAPYVVTAADIAAGVVRNIAVGTGTPPTGPPVVTPPATVDVPVADPGLDLDKLAVLRDTNADGFANVDELIDYTFVLTNTGNVTLVDVGVDDLTAGPVTCPVTVLAPGASVTCSALPYTVTEADVIAGVVHNVATGFGTPPGTGPPVRTPPVTRDIPAAEESSSGGEGNEAGEEGEGDTDTPLQPGPALALVKKAALHDQDGDGLADEGERIAYSFVVTNTGTVVLTGVGVDDPRLAGVVCPVTVLAPGRTVTCDAPVYVVTAADVAAGSVRNVATAFGTPPTGPPVISPPARTRVPADRPGDWFGGSGDAQGAGDASLAATGTVLPGWLLGGGLLLLVTGALLVVVVRPRRRG